jgi:hypothetical protein
MFLVHAARSRLCPRAMPGAYDSVDGEEGCALNRQSAQVRALTSGRTVRRTSPRTRLFRPHAPPRRRRLRASRTADGASPRGNQSAGPSARKSVGSASIAALDVRSGTSTQSGERRSTQSGEQRTDVSEQGTDVSALPRSLARHSRVRALMGRRSTAQLTAKKPGLRPNTPSSSTAGSPSSTTWPEPRGRRHANAGTATLL